LANLEKVLIIQLPADDFLFWDAVGRLADAFAKLALEDPYAECLQKMWTFDPFDRTIRINSPGVFKFIKEGITYYVFPSGSMKTVVMVYDPVKPIPFSCAIADAKTLEEFSQELAIKVFENL